MGLFGKEISNRERVEQAEQYFEAGKYKKARKLCEDVLKNASERPYGTTNDWSEESAACYWIGEMYENGLSLKTDIEKAFVCYLQSAKMYRYASKAMEKLVDMYLQGKGTPQNFGEAFKWSRRNILKVSEYAMNKLMNNTSFEKSNTPYAWTQFEEEYLTNTELTEEELIESIADVFEWRQELYEEGHMEDDYEYDKVYPSVITAWLLANKGNMTAQYMLGIMYGSGLSVSLDEDEAVYWLEQAANNGCAEACLCLGELKEEAMVANKKSWYYPLKEYDEIIEWYQKGAELGLEEAQELFDLFVSLKESTILFLDVCEGEGENATEYSEEEKKSLEQKYYDVSDHYKKIRKEQKPDWSWDK